MYFRSCEVARQKLLKPRQKDAEQKSAQAEESHTEHVETEIKALHVAAASGMLQIH